MIAEATTVDKMDAVTKLEFDGFRGAQSPQSFEGGPTDVLSLTGSGGLSLHSAAGIDGEEASEIRALE